MQRQWLSLPAGCWLFVGAADLALSMCQSGAKVGHTKPPLAGCHPRRAAQPIQHQMDLAGRAHDDVPTGIIGPAGTNRTTGRRLAGAIACGKRTSGRRQRWLELSGRIGTVDLGLMATETGVGSLLVRTTSVRSTTAQSTTPPVARAPTRQGTIAGDRPAWSGWPGIQFSRRQQRRLLVYL